MVYSLKKVTILTAVNHTGDSYGASVAYADTEDLPEMLHTGHSAATGPSDSGSMPSISVGYEEDPEASGKKILLSIL